MYREQVSTVNVDQLTDSFKIVEQHHKERSRGIIVKFCGSTYCKLWSCQMTAFPSAVQHKLPGSDWVSEIMKGSKKCFFFVR